MPLVVLGLAFTTTLINAAPVQAQAFHAFKVKLDLNPLPFTDVAQNAYWHGPSKYLAGNPFGQNPRDTWTTTLTLPKFDSAGDPNKSVAGGIISLKEIYFEAQHRKSGEVHGRGLIFHGTINMKTNVIHFKQNGIFAPDDIRVDIKGVVRSWWTVKGTRIGPNVIHCELSLVKVPSP